jgi:tetratricopeptide (TPR) repeat protein
MMVRRWCGFALVALPVLAVPGPGAARQRVAPAARTDPSPSAVFAEYRARRFDAARAAFHEVDDWTAFYRQFTETAPAWPANWAAAFAVEAAAEQLVPRHTIPSRAAEALLRAGWKLLQAKGADSAFGHQWALTAVAIEDGPSDAEFGAPAFFPDPDWKLLVDRLLEVFPQDPRLQLAAAYQRDAGQLYQDAFVRGAAWTTDVIMGPAQAVSSGNALRTRMARRSARLAALRKEQAIRAEAALRAGFWKMWARDPQGALSLFAEAEQAAAGDQWTIYLARLFRARVLADLGRDDPAIAACQAALRAWPDADSARRLLAALFEDAGRHGEAAALARVLLTSPAPADPWAWFAYGDYRFLAERLHSLRSML